MAFVIQAGSVDFASVRIETERLVLRSISASDTQSIFDHFTVDINRYLMPAPPSSLADTEAFVDMALAGLEDSSELHLAITKQANGEFLGLCGVHDRNAEDEIEFGIWIKKSAHGHGYGREAIAGLKDWAEEHLQYRQIIYPVDRSNIQSRRIAEHLGGEIIGERRERSLAGNELDLLIYGIRRSFTG
jgi:RimJ/RimL family protein N-acetyltransferase